LGIGAASPGVNGEQCTAVVVFTREKQFVLFLGKRLFQVCCLLGDLFSQAAIDHLEQ
jgi:hypothetical protein